jgi:NTE family protein
MSRHTPFRNSDYGSVSLVFQGGGALGAYQAGVYEALHESQIEPDWVCGVSIGAINSAIIAGNSPGKRVEKLKEFWERITDRKVWIFTPDGDLFRTLRNSTSALLTMLQGQPGFFKPRGSNPWLSFAGSKDATSYYDCAPLKDTLLDLVDFSLINEGLTRISVGAVNVRTGNFIYFDNFESDFSPENVMASGALPPAFPMTQIGTDYYWDGGIVSNTPLQHLLEQEIQKNMIVFQVDLFSSRGNLPRDMQQVMERHKDIMYASRTRYNTDVFTNMRKWKNIAFSALKKLPKDELTQDEIELLKNLGKLPKVTICQLIYQQQAYEGDSKDFEFSRTSMRDHWRAGYTDTKRTLSNHAWLEPTSDPHGVKIYDVHLEREYSLNRGVKL